MVGAEHLELEVTSSSFLPLLTLSLMRVSWTLSSSLEDTRK